MAGGEGGAAPAFGQINATSAFALLDLPPPALTRVLQHLRVKDIVACSRACRALRDAAADDAVWRAKAAALYPPGTVEQRRQPHEGGAAAAAPLHYPTFRALVADGNAANTSWVLPLDASSAWKDNRAGAYYECRLLGLEWDGASGDFWLHFDARGEPDLRPMAASSVGFVVARAGAGFNRGAAARAAARAAAERDAHEARMAAALGARDFAAADAARAAFHRARARLRALHERAREAEAGEPAFGDLLSVARPTRARLVVEAPGHFKGSLAFAGLDRAERAADELPAGHFARAAALERGVALVFCYANPLPLMPVAPMVDYHAAPLLALRPRGGTLREAFRRGGARRAARGAPAAALAAEGPAADAERWAHVGAEVLGREPPWLV